jgi:hypothetical protein
VNRLLALADQERDQLATCEQAIERGLRTFVEVGEALLTIRDSRLYREDHPTFEDYCRERWGMSIRHGQRMMEAAQVVKELEPLENATNWSLPATEAQARELAPLREDPKQMAEAWMVAVDTTPNGKPTAEHIRSVVQDLTSPEEAASLRVPGNPPLAKPQPLATWSDDERALQQTLQAGQTITVNFRSHQNLIVWAQAHDLFVRIDRLSIWGNPFELDKDGDRATVIANYRDHYLPHKPSLLIRTDELKGKALGCWCAPEACHGDVLAGEAVR